MNQLFTSRIGRLRLAGYLEGISLLILVGVAVPLKYISHDPSWVKIIGPIHGALFLLYVLNVTSAAIEKKWAFKSPTLGLLVACLIPFGTFYADQKILSKVQ